MTAMAAKELSAIACIDGGGDLDAWPTMVMTVKKTITRINMILRRVVNRARRMKIQSPAATINASMLQARGRLLHNPSPTLIEAFPANGSSGM
jgi:hypothetical protein